MIATMRPSENQLDVLRFLNLIWLPGEIREMRILRHNAEGHTASGYFDSPQAMAEAAVERDGSANLYCTLNPVKPDLLSRSPNRVDPRAFITTSDSGIVKRNWLFLDVDPVRESGQSSTNDELATAEALGVQIVEYLAEEGWSEPVIAMSGNGLNLIYRVDLANDDESKNLVGNVLQALAEKFNNTQASVDIAVSNAARLIGIIGAMKVKGQSTPVRPHRRSLLRSVPDEMFVVSTEALRVVASSAPKAHMPPPAKIYSGPSASTRLPDLLDRHGINYRPQPSDDSNGVTWYHVEKCPFHDDECKPFECGVGQRLPDGPYAGHCFHPEGVGKTWQDWKIALGIEFNGNGTTAEPTLSVNSGDSMANVVNSFPLTDAGNAELFAHLYGHRLRYDHAKKRWLIWDSHRWISDSDGELRRLAKNASRKRFVAAVEIEDLDARKKVAKFSVGSESRARLDACLVLSQSERPIADAGKHWDADPYLLGVANGVLDLHSGKLRPGKPGDRITMNVPFDFDPQATCPRWEQFLQEVFQDDSELIEFIQRAVGYSLTGSMTQEQVLFLCHGTGANGKSVFLNVLRHLGGDYAMNMPFTVLELNQQASQTNDLAAMATSRLVTSSETNESTRLNEARIKALTGGDPITARFLYGEFFTYEPVATFWLAVNHLPRVRDDSHGFWRRVRVLPFTQRFDGKDADQDLTSKLLNELPGILSWAVRGALSWQRDGLAPPDTVVVATEAYREESDELADFFSERCVQVERARVEPRKLFSDYQDWAKDQGIPERSRLGSRTFSNRIGERFGKAVSSNGKREYHGVGLMSTQ